MARPTPRLSRRHGASCAPAACSLCSRRAPGSGIGPRSALPGGAPDGSRWRPEPHSSRRLFLGPVPKPKRVQVAFGEPIAVHELEATPEAAGQLIEDELWPEVTAEYKRLLARPGVIAAGLAAAGLTAFLAERTRRRRR